MKFQNKLSNWVVILITAIAIYVVFKSNYWNYKDRVITWDIISYYDYLPAAFIYKDIKLDFLENNPGDRNYIFWYGIAPNGGKYFKMSMGLAMLYAPFFFLGHLGAHIFNYHTGGFSEPYKMALVFSCIFYVWLGLFFLRKALKKYFSEPITAFVLILIVFGTNYFNYATFDAPMSHVYSFALFAAFILMTQRWYDNPSLKNSVLIGLLSGIISLIRPTNIIIVFIFIFYFIHSRGDIAERIRFYKRNISPLLIIILFAFIVWIPQMLYWKTVTGNYLFYSYDDEGFFFANPQIFRGLFSYRNGWLVYAPVMLFALLGIPFLKRYAKEFFLPMLLFILINIFVILSWWCWWYTGFGNRAMIDSYAVLAFPLAAFIKWNSQLKRKIIKYSIFILILFAFFQGLFHSIQFHFSSIHYNSMTKEAYWESFWKVGPTREYWKKLREPDYDLAMKGILGYLDERNDSLMLYCDLEKTHRDSRKITDSAGRYKITSLDSLSNEYSRSGQNSIYVTDKNPYGLGFEFYVYTNEKYCITVWRKKTGINSYLVVSNKQNADYYFAENSAVLSEGDWEKIQMEIEITPAIHNTVLRVYVMNENPEKVYFDDLRIARIY